MALVRSSEEDVYYRIDSMTIRLRISLCDDNLNWKLMDRKRHGVDDLGRVKYLQ